jgi:hypothetical protein
MPENPYGYAVMYLNGDDMGEYLGYFQDSLDTAKSVADELHVANADAASAAGVGATPIGIYKLVLVETIEAPVEEDDDDA